MLAGSRPKVVYTSWAAAFAVEIWARLRQMTSTVWKNDFGTLPFQLQQRNPCEWQDRMVPKAGKTTTVLSLASNWKNIPLAMKC